MSKKLDENGWKMFGSLEGCTKLKENKIFVNFTHANPSWQPVVNTYRYVLKYLLIISVLHRAGLPAGNFFYRTENFITSRPCWPATFGPVEYILKRIFASRISAQAGGFLPRNCPCSVSQMSLAAGQIVPIPNLPLKFPPRGYNRAESLGGDFFPGIVTRLASRISKAKWFIFVSIWVSNFRQITPCSSFSVSDWLSVSLQRSLSQEWTVWTWDLCT